MRTNQNGMLPSRRVRIPFLNTPESHTPARDCVLHAAENAGIKPALMAMHMSHFFEAVANQVTMRRVVTIPGFGSFGPKTRFRHVPSKLTGDLPCAYPAFVASPGFKLDVKMRVRPALTPETDPMRRFVRNGSARQRHTRKSSAETFQNVRRAILNFNDGSARARRQKIT